MMHIFLLTEFSLEIDFDDLNQNQHPTVMRGLWKIRISVISTRKKGQNLSTSLFQLSKWSTHKISNNLLYWMSLDGRVTTPAQRLHTTE